MQWLIALLALILFIALAIRFSQSRRALMATAAIIALLAAAGSALLYVENRQSAERTREARGLIRPEEIDITDASFTYEYGRWHLRGTLVNHSPHTITGLTLHVRVEDCPPRAACETVGEADTSTVGLNVAPRQTHRLDLIVRLPDMPTPQAMKWDYTVTEVRAGRE
jgi:hypothetical protein